MKNLLFIILIFIQTACAPGTTKQKDAAISGYDSILVREVVDGDTIKLANGKLLRYIGIDTPETRIKRGNRFVYRPQPGALEATKYNKLLVSGKKVRVEFDVEKTDTYGRLLGYCWVDDIFVNARLLEQGYAVLSTHPPNLKYVDLFVKVQREAREARRGLWGAYALVDHTTAHRYINQVRTVRGTVVAARKTKKTILLHFDDDPKTDFTIAIFSDSYQSFKDAGIDPLTFYTGKIVEISGRIRSYNGPEIIAATPHDIEVAGLHRRQMITSSGAPAS